MSNVLFYSPKNSVTVCMGLTSYLPALFPLGYGTKVDKQFELFRENYDHPP